MTRLLRAEFRRFFKRRLTLLGLLGALSLMLVLSWAIYSSTRPPSAEDLVQQQANFEQTLKEWESYGGPAQLEECKKAATAATPDPNGNWAGMTEKDCEAMRPALEHFGWTAPRIDEAIAAIPGGTVFSLGLIAIVLAASFIGAEFSTGSIGNWLTYEPRRTRVFASKMVVVVVASAALGIIGNTVMTLVTWLSVNVNEGTMTWPPGTLTHVVHTYWRGVLMIVAMGLIAASLAFLTRHTAAVIGVMIGWMMIVEGTLMGLVERLRNYSLVTNLDAWITGQSTISDYNCDGVGGCQTVERTITWVHGGVVWGLLTAALVGLAWLVFSRRDVT
ncbi:MAG TPA: ABC transporter permease subunit [Propionibacteriaceae bacterium]|nr:ABC transporter permease subunit [Propionibacteriaceae bacterium]